MEVKRTERGWVGHFILGHRCLFRRNTLLERGDERVVISTVGNLIDNDTNNHNTIAWETWYETMAFTATNNGGYLDADVGSMIDFESESCLRAKTWSELIEKYPLVDNVANDMHEKVVEEIERKL